jgi:tetratricopeptide (TPR) repeat protein
MRRIRCAVNWLALMSICVSSGAAAAAARGADADKLIQEGVELRRSGDDVTALERFQQALELTPSPRALAQVGLAEQALGRWTQAYEHLHKALDAKGDLWTNKHRAALVEALDHVSDHVGKVEILGGSPGAEVRFDGSPRGTLPVVEPILVPTGKVTIDIVSPGFVSVQRITVVHARESVRESFDRLVRLSAAVDSSNTSTQVGVGGAPVAFSA